MKTLEQALLSISIEKLGPIADHHDLMAFREALKRAWPHPAFGADEDVEELIEDVLEGRAGRDEHGRDWVQVAATRAAGGR